MKTYFLSTIIVCIAILLNTSSCTQNDNTSEIDVGSTSDSTATSPMLTFEESNHDFGTVIQGEKVSHSFIYINTGNADLIISSATGSCGCTVPEYSKEPLAPGESRKMNVIFDSSMVSFWWFAMCSN